MKTWKSMTKRFKVTKNKKVLKKKAGQNHLNTKERGKTVMGKRRKIGVPKSVTKAISRGI